MSVRGEFERVLNDCLGQLEGREDAAAARIADLLARAREQSGDDVSAAADLLLSGAKLEAEAEPPLVFEQDDTRAVFEELLERLASISRIILGR